MFRCHNNLHRSLYVPRFLRSESLTQQRHFAQKLPDIPFNKILIANRGEIAVRIIRTCQKLGIKTVQVHSEADAGSLPVDMADETICIGPPASRDSYLQIERIVNAVKMTGAQAVHPGFGFLSENNDFAAALEAEDIVFIGPNSRAIELMGDKIVSKETAQEAQVNVIPGDNRVIADVEECIAVSNQIGYPVMVKASAGGGGKGMRISYSDAETRDAFRLATNEAISSFNDGRLFVEKFIEDPRHIEIQVLGDAHGNAIYLNERECSIQRRNQKIVEEAPSVALDEELRREMGRQACDMARKVNYNSAGTVEFLVDKHKNFYFLEMNTRLQVEHPVTEFITGVDLVEHMIRVAAGQELSLTQNDIGINGWAFESRVYAEDPFKGFLPSTGVLNKYREPSVDDPRVRVDSGIRENAEISVHYDPMISKLITWGKDRNEALTLMRNALDEYVIHGVNHNIPFLRSILDHPRFVSGNITTKFIPEEYPEGFGKEYIKLSEQDKSRIAQAASVVYSRVRKDLQPNSKLCVVLDDGEESSYRQEYLVNEGEGNEVNLNGEYSFTCDFQEYLNVFRCNFDGEECIFQLFEKSSHGLTLLYKGIKYDCSVMTEDEDAVAQYMPVPEVIDYAKALYAPMPGNIFSLSINPGDRVVEGQEVCIIEAMKMQNVFYAQKDGVVKGVYAKVGDSVAADQLIYDLE